ncbi:alpha/beta fold hydrolase [Streptomyces sp. NPDC021019]|uniref:alpha/beta fold hydrolase n=1 Tax=unclassified Streptomyces TaxID=2593676 RepID=UPI00379C5038
MPILSPHGTTPLACHLVGAGGARPACRVRGEEPPPPSVVLLLGRAGSSVTWPRIAEHLAADHRVYARRTTATAERFAGTAWRIKLQPLCIPNCALRRAGGPNDVLLAGSGSRLSLVPTPRATGRLLGARPDRTSGLLWRR